MRAFAILAVIAGPVVAEVDPEPYRPILERCLAGTEPGEAWEICIGRSSEACMQTEEGGFTTLGTASCLGMERDLWDVQLNRVYREQIAAAKLRDAEEATAFDGAFANLEDSLRAAQRAWIPFRDAQCALEYAYWGSGSMRQIAGAGCHMRMTAERTIELLTAVSGMVGE